MLIVMILASLFVSATNRIENKGRQIFTQNAFQTTREQKNITGLFCTCFPNGRPPIPFSGKPSLKKLSDFVKILVIFWGDVEKNSPNIT